MVDETLLNALEVLRKAVERSEAKQVVHWEIEIDQYICRKDGEYGMLFRLTENWIRGALSRIGNNKGVDIRVPREHLAKLLEDIEEEKRKAQQEGYERLAETIVGGDLPNNVSPASRVPQLHDVFQHSEVLAWHTFDTEAVRGTLFFIERSDADAEPVYLVLPEDSHELIRFDHARLSED